VDELSVNIVDIVVLGILLLSALVAFGMGFTRTVLYFAAWGAALYAAVRFYPLATPYAQKYLEGQLGEFAAGFAIFVGVLLVCWIIAHLLTRGIRRSMFSTADRILGLGLGGAIGVVIVCVAYQVLAWMIPVDTRPDWLMEARSLPYVEAGTRYLQAVLPESLIERTALVADEAKRRADEAATVEHNLPALGFSSAPPAPAGSQDAAPAAPKPGYGDNERKSIDRVVESTAQ
jgi:membrane protein required for colicin V production